MKTSEKRPGMAPQIETMFVAIGRTKEGDEGIVGTIQPGQGQTPIVFSDTKHFEQLDQILKSLAHESGETIEIIAFSRANVVRRFLP